MGRYTCLCRDTSRSETTTGRLDSGGSTEGGVPGIANGYPIACSSAKGRKDFDGLRTAALRTRNGYDRLRAQRQTFETGATLLTLIFENRHSTLSFS